MLKRMLTLGLAIALISLLSTVAFADDFNYDDTGTVAITLNIPQIQVLDFGASETTLTWVPVTAADLDNEFVVSKAATSFTVSSNDATGFEVTVDAGQSGFTFGGEVQSDSTHLAITKLHYRSYVISGGANFDPAVGDSDCGSGTGTGGTWVDFVAADGSCATNVVGKGLSTGKDLVVAVDYKIDPTWHTAQGDYTVTLTYTLGTWTTP